MTPDDSAQSLEEGRNASVSEASDPLDAIGIRDRLWLRAILPILHEQTVDLHPNPRVQFALDRLQIAACERAARILSSDLAPTSA